MNTQLQDTFDKVNEASPTLAQYVTDASDVWQDGTETLSVVKAAQYSHGLSEMWNMLSQEEKQRFFAAVEAAVADAGENISTVWCTGFLESLSNYLDEGKIPVDEAVTYIGPESLKYLNEWNEQHGLSPYA